jgi:hypothetical protein
MTDKIVITAETCRKVKRKFVINTSGQIHLSHEMLFELLRQCSNPEDQLILNQPELEPGTGSVYPPEYFRDNT